MMIADTGHVMTLANSIIGVGILAMPFCFQKCGVLLSIVLLVVSNFTTRLCCHYLIKSSLLTRRKSFEFLGFHAFGSSGKLIVELCIIGYLIGTCIAYFVVVGDLGPPITAKVLNIPESDRLRTWVMIIVTILCVIPLGLLKNVDSLAAVCTASIGFYLCLVCKVMSESKEHLANGNWIDHVEYWKPSGILQCLPIFSMALSCQMQLFEVYETVPNVTVEKMNRIVKSATAICTGVYIFVGFFGYVAFCTQEFSGNILVNFSQSFVSDAIKMGFVLSVAFSFPLVIFPCRASIYSLLYKRGQSLDTSGYIPDFRFKWITVAIVLTSLSMGLILPSIELVIGLVGSTIGIGICIIFPASCFIKISKKDSTEKTLAHFILIAGFCLMILGTYANLNAIDKKNSGTEFDSEHTKQSFVAFVEKVDGFGKFPIDLNLDLKTKTERETIKLNVEMKENFEQNILSNKTENDLNLRKNLNKSRKTGEFKTNFVKNLNSSLPNQVDSKDVSKIKILNDKIKKSDQMENINGTSIDKNAIKKEEEIAAEEKVKENAAKKEAVNDELNETKDLLKETVDELKEVLAKNNKETQDLVMGKLLEVAERVEEIGRNIEAEKANEEKHDNFSPKSEIIKEITIRKEIKSDFLNNSFKGPLINALSADAQPVPENKVYEPESYKLGEKVNDAQHNLSLNETVLRLPIPILLDDSKKKIIKIPPADDGAGLKPDPNIDGKSLPEISQNSLPVVAEPVKSNLLKVGSHKTDKETETLKVSIEESKSPLPSENNAEKEVLRDDDTKEIVPDQNHEWISRDILDLSAKKNQEKSQREKRSIYKDVCVNNLDMKLEDCLKEINIKMIPDLQVQSIGRDLKSIVENDEDKKTLI